MFERFGEMSSCREINELAENLLNEGDIQSLKTMAQENGIPEDYVEMYQSGDIPYLCDAVTAAMGKLDVECRSLKLAGLMNDWVEYIRGLCMEDEMVAHQVRKKGKSLKDAIKPECFLGIYKRRLRDLKTLQGNPDYLKVWQMEKRMGLHVTVQESIFLAESQVRQNDLEEILKYTTVAKFMHRIEQYSGCGIPDTMQEPMCGRAAGAVSGVTRTYVDYLHMRIQRGYDLHNQIFLFPRDLRLAHDQMVIETNAEEIRKREQAVSEKYPDIRKNYRGLRNQYIYEDEDYLIRPARSAEEIVAEGRILHHCVGGDSYLNKHNTGRSTILFLRSKLAPETPYITIEICGTKILQWYGIRDTKPDEIRIERHLRRYIKALKEKDQIKSVTA